MNKTPKPIFIVELPTSVDQAHLVQIRDDFKDKMNDYHVFIYVGKSEEAEFQTFYEKDFNEVKYEELKQIVEGNINKVN